MRAAHLRVLARRPVVSMLALVAVALAVLPACGKPNEHKLNVQAAIRRTDALAARFVYEDKRPDLPDGLEPKPKAGQPTGAIPLETIVQGLIEDDFRYKARVALDGAGAFEKIVSDDVLAIRFLDPARLPGMVDRAVLGRADTKTDIPGVSVIEALKTQRWVVDPEGAPSLVGISNADRALGVDPINDSLSVFDYVLTCIDQAQSVDRYSKDALDPTYKPTEDPFPKPSEGSDVIRYDLRRPRLPPIGSTSGSGRPDIPATKHFRKMAIYVKDGRVVQVLERIELTGKSVEDFLDYNKAFAREQGLTKKEVDEIAKQQLAMLPKDVSNDDLGMILLAGLSFNLSQFGGDPIVQRAMSLDLQDLGAPNRVDVPNQDVVRGSLAVLLGSGHKPQEVSGGSAPTTTTTIAPEGSPDGGSTDTSTSTP